MPVTFLRSTRHVAPLSLSCAVGCLLFLGGLGFASADAGEPIVIATGTGSEAPLQPQAVVSASGSLEVVYGTGDLVFHTRSIDGGRTFSPPVKAAECRNMSLGMRRGPRVAVSGETVVVSAIGGDQGKGRDGNLQSWRRTADGSWQGPSRVNDVADSAREGLHAMASGPEGTVWCVWLDLRNRRTELYGAYSTDAGATWSPNMLVYQSPDKSICECCHPSILIDDTGAVHVMFRNSLGGDRDMYLCSSTDQKSFSAAVRLGKGHWKLDACPMDGGMLAENPEQGVATVWRRDSEIYLTTRETPEQHLGAGEQPWITATKKGLVVVWSRDRDAELLVWRSRTQVVESLADRARDAVVVATGEGQRAVAFWEERADSGRVLKAVVIEP